MHGEDACAMAVGGSLLKEGSAGIEEEGVTHAPDKDEPNEDEEWRSCIEREQAAGDREQRRQEARSSKLWL